MRALTLALALLVAAQASASDWVGSWTAPPQATWGEDFALPVNAPSVIENQTVRQVVRSSVGGKRVRILLSNEYGIEKLTIGSAHIALADDHAASAIAGGSDRVVTFGGKKTITIPPGAPALSDPIDLVVPALTNLAVSLHLPARTKVTSFHWDGGQTAYLAPGDQSGAAHIVDGAKLLPRLFLRAVEIETDTTPRVVVALGDSITDGAGSTADRNHRWPDFLAQRLVTRNVAVLNAGISGGRLLRDGMGANALARFERDVLAQPHVSSVVVLLGINDIAWPGHVFDPAAPRPTVEELAAGYRQLIDRAHGRNIRVIGATLTPFEGALEGTPLAGYFSPDRDRLRQAVNHWIRTGGAFDAVVDFDALLRDPARPSRFLPEFDSGDHLHPGDLGYERMAQALDPDLLLGSQR